MTGIRRTILLWLFEKIAWKLYGKYDCDSFEFIRADNGKEFVVAYVVKGDVE